MTPPADSDDCVHVDLPEGDGFKCVICGRTLGPPEITVGKGLEAVRAVRQMLHPRDRERHPLEGEPMTTTEAQTERPVCDIGPENHTWRVTIDEGCVEFKPIEPCDEFGSCEGSLPDTDYFDGEIVPAVRLKFWSDCPTPIHGHYDGPCDCDWGVRVEPATIAPDRPEVVCLCGSTRFIDAFDAANLRLTLDGRIVLSIGCVTSTDVGLGIDDATKERLDVLHKRKIDLADRVLVLNVGGYIGDSTRSEIAHAELTGKRIDYLEPIPAEAPA